MKKIFLILLSVAAITAFVSCGEKPVAADNLPQKAKTFLSTYFPGIEVVSVIKDNDGYDVDLIDGTDVDFRKNGEWKNVDCEGRPVPVGFFPTGITTYVAEHYPMTFIEDIQFDHNRYEVGLNDPIDVDLIFDANGNFVRIDD